MSQDKLEKALTIQADRNNAPDVTSKVCDEMKNSSVFQYNWEDILQPAPIAISSVGACYTAALADAGRKVILEPPTSGSFQYLRDKSLSANLVTCGDLGSNAFSTAATNMAFIKNVSDTASNKVTDVIESLMDPGTANKLLKRQMQQMKNAADDGMQKALQIDQKFEDWLFFACELYSACVGIQSSDDEKISATQLGLVVEQTRFDSQKNTTADSNAVRAKLGRCLDAASQAFKKASGEFPPGWDIMGQEIIASLAEATTTALVQFITDFTQNMNPVAKASAGVGKFGGLIYGKSNPDGKSIQAPPTPRVTTPPNSLDPAYTYVQKDMPLLDTLNAILTTGNNGGVNWDDFSASKSAVFVLQMLKDAQSAFASQATANPPSTDLSEILRTAVEVTNALVEEAKKGTSGLSSNFPTADSSTVKDWQSKFNTQFLKAQSLYAAAKSLPGTAAGGIPIMADTSDDPREQMAQTNTKSVPAQARLQAAQNRLATAQGSFAQTQDIYAKNVQLLGEQENKLTTIQAELQSLAASKGDLDAIKGILLDCIKLVVQCKQQFMNLVTTFKAISASADAIVTYHVQGFIDSFSNGNSLKISAYTFTDLQRSIVYGSAVTLRCQFSLVGQIARMYVNLSMQNVMPGLQMLNEISAMGLDTGTSRKVANLQGWASQSLESSKRIAHDGQTQISGRMGDRVREAEGSAKQVSAAPAVQQAIQGGTEEVKKAALDALTTNAAAKPLNRF